jgi:hypothetical protein
MFATAAEKAGLETIDDANDFDVGGEDEILTGYEAIVMADDHLIENPVEESTPDASEPPSEDVSDTPESTDTAQ